MRLSPVFSACAAFCLAIAAATYPWVAQLFIMAIGFAALIDALLDLGWGDCQKVPETKRAARKTRCQGANCEW